jgi:phosphonate transport system ATP-binding protein
MALLEIEDITKSYKEVMALAGVSLSVSQGELVAIIGPSGAGKSTLLRCINRLVDASSGRITFDGHAPSPQEAAQEGAGKDRDDLPAL